MEYALRLLSARDYPEKRLREKLRERFDSDEEEKTVARLKGYGYIDDDRYALSYIASKIRSGYGYYYIRAALWERGIDIDRNIYDKAVLDRELDLEYYANDALEKYLRKKRKKEIREQKRNAYAYMMRRGFDRELTDKLIREYFNNESDIS